MLLSCWARIFYGFETFYIFIYIFCCNKSFISSYQYLIFHYISRIISLYRKISQKIYKFSILWLFNTAFFIQCFRHSSNFFRVVKVFINASVYIQRNFFQLIQSSERFSLQKLDLIVTWNDRRINWESQNSKFIISYLISKLPAIPNLRMCLQRSCLCYCSLISKPSSHLDP